MTDQLDEREVVLYDDVPIGARWAGWLLLGIGGLVLTPAALVARYGWLLVVATPFLGCGVCLLQTRMRIAVDRRTLLVRVRYQLLRTLPIALAKPAAGPNADLRLFHIVDITISRIRVRT